MKMDDVIEQKRDHSARESLWFWREKQQLH